MLLGDVPLGDVPLARLYVGVCLYGVVCVVVWCGMKKIFLFAQ